MLERDQPTLILLVAIMLFLLVNFDPSLGQIYLGMLLLYYIMIDDTNYLSIGIFNQKKDYLLTFIYGAGTYVVFTLVAPYVVDAIFPSVTGTTIQSLTATYLQAALTSSTTAKIISFGLLIPIIETITLHGGLVQVYAKLLKTNIKDVFQVRTLWAIIFVGATFAIFHLTSKGVTNVPALFVSFLFAIVSVMLILFRNQYADAIIFHILTNLGALGFFNMFLGGK